MTTYEIAEIASVIRSLFPKSDWTEAMYELFGKLVGKLDVYPERARIIVEQYRADVRVRSPDLGTIAKRLKHEALTNRRNTDPAGNPVPPSPEQRSPRNYVPDPVHPGVLWRKKDGTDEVITMAEYRSRTGSRAK